MTIYIYEIHSLCIVTCDLWAVTCGAARGFREEFLLWVISPAGLWVIWPARPSSNNMDVISSAFFSISIMIKAVVTPPLLNRLIVYPVDLNEHVSLKVSMTSCFKRPLWSQFSWLSQKEQHGTRVWMPHDVTQKGFLKRLATLPVVFPGAVNKHLEQNKTLQQGHRQDEYTLV